jgi:Tfp pilus assembly protein PilN
MDNDAYQVAQGVGSLAFFLLLIVVAIQYRRRLRKIRRLTQTNVLLSQQLAAATARMDEMERWQSRSVAEGRHQDPVLAPALHQYRR